MPCTPGASRAVLAEGGAPPLAREILPSLATTMAEPILLACHGSAACLLLAQMATRHGLVTGATGTRTAVALQPRRELHRRT